MNDQNKQKENTKPITRIVDMVAAIAGVAVVSLEVLRFVGWVKNVGLYSALGMVVLLS